MKKQSRQQKQGEKRTVEKNRAASKNVRRERVQKMGETLGFLDGFIDWISRITYCYKGVAWQKKYMFQFCTDLFLFTEHC